MLLWRWLTTGSRTTKTAPRVTTDSKVVNALSKRVVSSTSTVFHTLGCGLPEIIYENALAYELRKSGLTVGQQQALPVYYDGVIVGDYTADLLVENTILLEMTVARCRNAVDTSQCLKYLKLTGYELCLVFNFGNPGLNIKRLRNRA